MESEIARLGREHLRTHGAAGLSLRAIARDLGVVSSAVYRYVPSRDELLTLLLVQGYSDLADSVDYAADEPLESDTDRVGGDRLGGDRGDRGEGPEPAGDSPVPSRQRLRRMALAMRAWAIADPARWALLYGSPVPGYAAPAERTVGPGTRVIARLLTEFDAAWRRGELREGAPASVDADAQLTADFDAVRREFGSALPDSVMVGAITLWATMIGGISLEVFGQYGADTFARPDVLFAAQIDAVLSTLFVG
ncbi:TetR/AcrR family transcriptional regulator [Gordonia otitidis]|uniref:TetR/AcrR family transcriptional regulator n=1 Tax=Gordonia otitidis TaxID=249058 RepID=UPI0038993143